MPIQCFTSGNLFRKASPKAISGRTSYLRVRLEFLRYPHLIRQLFNGGRFGPPSGFTPTSTWTWIGHPVSGLTHTTIALFRLGFPSASYLPVLNLATYNNSPDRSTKSTISDFNVLYLLVNIGFQVLFHSPPGVLFTFPSQYFSTIGHQVVFSLTEWSPLIHTEFLVLSATLDTAMSFVFSCTGLSPSLVSLSNDLLLKLGFPSAPHLKCLTSLHT